MSMPPAAQLVMYVHSLVYVHPVPALHESMQGHPRRRKLLEDGAVRMGEGNWRGCLPECSEALDE